MSRTVLLVVVAACARTAPAPAPTPAPAPLDDPVSTEAHRAYEAEARALVPDPARGGPVPSEAASPLPPFRHVDRGSSRYLGPGACAACHPAEAAVLAASAHAHSLETLAVAQREHDPSCLRCHVTGLGHPGGFATAGAAGLGLETVGCEACHGPGSAHLADPGRPYGELPTSGAACVACHTHDNSPDFRWEGYWPQVVHGG